MQFIPASCVFGPSSILVAGMPSLTLTEVGELRLQSLSFFLVVFLVSAWLVQWAWNTLAGSLTGLPVFRYKQALGLMVIVGLLIHVVLTMISGARELMTPGAWVKVGATYQLATPEPDSKTWLASARRAALHHLRDELWTHARAHGGRLPAFRESGEIREELWSGIHPQGVPLAYVPGLRPNVGSRILVYEPEDYGNLRMVLLTNGSVLTLSAAELKDRLVAEMESVRAQTQP